VPPADPWLLALLALVAIAVVLLVVLLVRRPPDPGPLLEELAARQAAALERTVRALREEFAAQSRQDRQELAVALERFGAGVNQQVGAMARLQNAQIDRFAAQLDRLTEANEKRLGEVRSTLEARLRELQADNAGKLEEMRRTVDEKLHATLEQRLGESFRLVSERLEQVHKGLGEMQALASDVGDLKRVLTNVKTRGVWGEVQLAALLEQMLVPEQYAANVATVPGSGERVEFAIRLPGSAADAPVWLPIDAKFPREDYERLMHAHEQADAPAAEAALRQLEQRLRLEARTIREKYLSPPHTTDFALMFLPVEGLYAEAVRRPGLVDELQRVHRVVVAGPTTLAAILSSLQMGFRTLAVEKRSSEVWQLLGAVKTEFGKLGDLFAKAREQVDKASRTLSGYETRSRAIERRLREVQALPEPGARAFLGDDPVPDGHDAGESGEALPAAFDGGPVAGRRPSD
jgi:DNA recombination protein RmuC